MQLDELTKVMAALGAQGVKLKVAREKTKLTLRKESQAYSDAHKLIADAIRKLATLL